MPGLKLSKDNPGFDCLAKANFVGEEQALIDRRNEFEDRFELVNLEVCA